MSEQEPGLAELQTRFVRRFLDITILKLLLVEPLWGYKMMAVLKDLYEVNIGPPVIYPLLDSMEADGLIQAESVYLGKRKRKVYKVLPQGKTMLKNMDRILNDFLAT